MQTRLVNIFHSLKKNVPANKTKTNNSLVQLITLCLVNVYFFSKKLFVFSKILCKKHANKIQYLEMTSLLFWTLESSAVRKINRNQLFGMSVLNFNLIE